MTNERYPMANVTHERQLPDNDQSGAQLDTQSGAQSGGRGTAHPDLSVWLIWGGIMLVAIAILPFAVRNHDVVRAIARMCGFDLG